jgi:hypothetical protein
MVRKICLALATVTAISAVALAPTSASAFGGKWGGGGNWGGGWGGGWGSPHWGHGIGIGLGLGVAAGVLATGTCLRKAVVDTPYGPVVRWVNVCD